MEKTDLNKKKSDLNKKNRIFFNFYLKNHDLYQPWMVLAYAAKRR